MAGRRAPISRRMAPLITQPWVGLASVIGPGLAWAAGIVPIGAAAAIGAAMVAAAAGALVLRPVSADGDGPPSRHGTEQARAIGTLDQSLSRLRALRADDLPPELATSSLDALTAADGVRPIALRVARAIDTLDDAIALSADVRSYTASTSSTIEATLSRLRARRAGLLQRLEVAVDGVSEIYARMLELGATVHTFDVTREVDDVGSVNDSLIALQQSFADLETDAAAVRATRGEVD